MSAFRSIAEIQAAFESRKISPSELVRDYLDRARSSPLNAYITISEERAMSQAKAAEAALARDPKSAIRKQPLIGVPLGIKDNMMIDGVRTTCASKMLANYVAPYTASAVSRLEEAGAVSLGKLNLDEFAMGGSNENSAFGPVRHPTHPERVPGGSSGGSSAAVKAGLCAAALGSDTGGSIRLPASYCGIVGLKPTYGRVSRYGLVAFASSLDQIGPMANTVEDAALLMDVMAGHDALDSTSSTAPLPADGFLQAARKTPDWSKLRIGIPKEYFVAGLDPDVERRIQEAIAWFKGKGAKLVEVSLPHTKYSVAVYYLVAVSEASSNLARFDGVRFGVRPEEAAQASDLADFYRKVRSNFGPEVKRRIILGTFALSAGYSEAYYRRACQVRRLVQRDFDEAFARTDVILGPVSPTTAFKLGEKSSDPLKMYLNDIFTIPSNLAGIPSMSIPAGEDSQGLPVGLHLMAPAFAEERLLSIAHAFEMGRA